PPPPPEPPSFPLHDALPILEALRGHPAPRQRPPQPCGPALVHRLAERPAQADHHAGRGGAHRPVAASEHLLGPAEELDLVAHGLDRKSTRLNSSHVKSSYAA